MSFPGPKAGAGIIDNPECNYNKRCTLYSEVKIWRKIPKSKSLKVCLKALGKMF